MFFVKERQANQLVIFVFGFYDMHIIAKKFKHAPQKNEVLGKLKAAPTHFSPTGFRTEKGIKEIIKVLK